MLARLILTLLLAAFALPAMAAAPCHDTPAPMVMAPHHAMPGVPRHEDGRHDDGAIVAHACIGCIPPSTMEPRAVSHPPIATDTMLIGTIVPFAVRGAPAPATPPPRAEA